MIGGVEEHPIGPQRADQVDETIVQVALLTRLQRIGELVLVEVEGHGQVRQGLTSQREKDGQVQHIGYKQHIGLIGPCPGLARQSDRPALHAPLPEAPGQG